MNVRSDVEYGAPHTILKEALGNSVFRPNEYSYLATASGRERNFNKASYEDQF
jgi:hypothetical protein